MTTQSESSTQFVLVEPPRERPRPAPQAKKPRHGIVQAELLVTIRMEIKEGRFAAARLMLQQARSLGDSPVCNALLGRCKAELNPTCIEAVTLCQGAVQRERTPETLFQLGRVHLIRGNRGEAVEAFEAGLAINPNYKPILEEYDHIGRRHPSVLPFLSRDNAINRGLGQLLAKAGMR